MTLRNGKEYLAKSSEVSEIPKANANDDNEVKKKIQGRDGKEIEEPDEKEIQESAGTWRLEFVIAIIGIIGIALTYNLLKDLLTGIEREIAIGVVNESDQQWEAASVYFSSGTSDAILPDSVPNTKALLYHARNTKGTARGAVGVFTYHITVRKDQAATLAVLFHVPFDNNLYSNWWNVKIYEGHRRANDEMYDELYYKESPFKGINKWYSKSLGYGLKARGFMASSGTPALKIHVNKA